MYFFFKRGSLHPPWVYFNWIAHKSKSWPQRKSKNSHWWHCGVISLIWSFWHELKTCVLTQLVCMCANTASLKSNTPTPHLLTYTLHTTLSITSGLIDCTLVLKPRSQAPRCVLKPTALVWHHLHTNWTSPHFSPVSTIHPCISEVRGHGVL